MVKRTKAIDKHGSVKKQRKYQLQLLRAEILKDDDQSLPAEPQSFQDSNHKDTKTSGISNDSKSKSKVKRRSKIQKLNESLPETKACLGSDLITEMKTMEENVKTQNDQAVKADILCTTNELESVNSSEVNMDEIDDSEALSNKHNQEMSDAYPATVNKPNNIDKVEEVNRNQENTMLKPIKLKVKRMLIPGTTIEVKVLDGNNQFITDSSFCSLINYGVSEVTLKVLNDHGFTNMTSFQIQTIPALLQGRDLFAVCSVKSKKILSYLIPGLEILQKLNFEREHGTGIVILLPTQELVHEYYSLVSSLVTAHNLTCSYIMGVNSKVVEESELREGANVVVATPGHLLHHVHNSNTFKYVNLQYLAIDGAHHMFELGFEYELKRLSKLLPKHRQTLLLTALQTEKTQDLARYCLKKTPFYVCDEDVDISEKVKNLAVEYIVCPPEKRLLLLLTLLQSNRDKKVVLLVSSCMSAQFHYNILSYKDISCTCIHGKQKLEKKTSLSKFNDTKCQVLICTNAAALEISVTQVDLIVQYDPPDELQYYVDTRGHVIGDISATARTLLLLRPEEAGFVAYLHEHGVKTNSIKFPATSILNIQNEIENDLKTMYFLHVSSREGYQAFIKAYASHVLSSIFEMEKLDLVKVARSFGFSVPPYVDFNVHNRQLGRIAHRTTDASMKVKVLLKSVDQVKKMKKKEIFLSYKT